VEFGLLNIVANQVRRCHALLSLAAAGALLAIAPPAMAAAYTYQPAGAGGSYYSNGVIVNTDFGGIFPTNDGSNFRFFRTIRGRFEADSSV
jgi:hypothetical protein